VCHVKPNTIDAAIELAADATEFASFEALGPNGTVFVYEPEMIKDVINDLVLGQGTHAPAATRCRVYRLQPGCTRAGRQRQGRNGGGSSSSSSSSIEHHDAVAGLCKLCVCPYRVVVICTEGAIDRVMFVQTGNGPKPADIQVCALATKSGESLLTPPPHTAPCCSSARWSQRSTLTLSTGREGGVHSCARQGP